MLNMDSSGASSSTRRPTPYTDLTDEILILSNYFYPEPTGSAPPISDLAVWLAENGLKPSVLTARPSYPKSKVYKGYADGERDREEYSGVRIRRIPSIVPKSRGILGRLVAETSFALSALSHKRRRYRVVVCVCPSIFIVSIANIFRRKHGNTIAIVHDIQSGLGSNLSYSILQTPFRILRWIEVWSFNRCNKLIAVSDAMAEELRRIGIIQPIVVIPPQVDVREILPTEEHSRRLIVYSGNLGRKQGLNQVVDLAAELLRRGSSTSILIRGEGSERANLERQVAEKNLVNVSFSGLTPRSEISESLGLAALHLVPQDPHGVNFALPSKIFSIMAARRAYVATAYPQTPLEIITRESKAGVCVPPGDPISFANAVEALLNDQAARLELARAGRLYVERVVDREVVCTRILKVISPDVSPQRG